MESLWDSDGNKGAEYQKGTYSFINESDLFLKENITNKHSEKIEMHFKGMQNPDAITSQVHTIAEGLVRLDFDDSKLENVPIERGFDHIKDTDKQDYNKPEYYIVFDNIPDNNTPEQDTDLINIKIVNTETGNIKEVFLPKAGVAENVSLESMPDGQYQALAQKIKIELDNMNNHE